MESVADPNLLDSLLSGLGALDMALDEEQQSLLLDYVALLARWNRAYNLTAVRRPEQMIGRHILDSLAVLKYVPGGRLLDVGTGAGLPGMVFAIARPELRVVLLDGNGKKTRFCTQVVSDLNLDNVNVVQERVESFRPKTPFSCLTARAFGSVRDVVEHGLLHCAEGGRVLAMKGVHPSSEMAEVEQWQECLEVKAVQVPGVDAERHVVIAELDCIRNIEE